MVAIVGFCVALMGGLIGLSLFGIGHGWPGMTIDPRPPEWFFLIGFTVTIVMMVGGSAAAIVVLLEERWKATGAFCDD